MNSDGYDAGADSSDGDDASDYDSHGDRDDRLDVGARAPYCPVSSGRVECINDDVSTQLQLLGTQLRRIEWHLRRIDGRDFDDAFRDARTPGDTDDHDYDYDSVDDDFDDNSLDRSVEQGTTPSFSFNNLRDGDPYDSDGYDSRSDDSRDDFRDYDDDYDHDYGDGQPAVSSKDIPTYAFMSLSL